MHIKPKPKKRLRALLALGIFVLICADLAYGWYARPSDELHRVNTPFPPYVFTRGLPAGLRVDTQSVVYRDGLLFFRLTGANHTVAVTEQSLPHELADTTARGDEEVTGAPGSAAVSFRDDQVIGTLLGDNKQTMVLIRADAAAGAETIKDVIRALDAR